MTVFLLSETNSFPPVYLAEKNGLLAIGGDLSEERLLQAYRQGIFPWYAQGDPILWWSPEPRTVLYPDRFVISRTLRKVLKRNLFNITFDYAFSKVIAGCASVHTEKHADTWIVEEMGEAYIRLHERGYAHSVEAWADGILAGGLYGVAMGRCFFGESMFTQKPNASKVAFAVLVRYLKSRGFHLIDCQMKTDHLMRFGAVEIPRKTFIKELTHALSVSEPAGKWVFDLQRISPETGTLYALE